MAVSIRAPFDGESWMSETLFRDSGERPTGDARLAILDALASVRAETRAISARLKYLREEWFISTRSYSANSFHSENSAEHGAAHWVNVRVLTFELSAAQVA
jgi:hypothetical protein